MIFQSDEIQFIVFVTDAILSNLQVTSVVRKSVSRVDACTKSRTQRSRKKISKWNLLTGLPLYIPLHDSLLIFYILLVLLSPNNNLRDTFMQRMQIK